MPDRPDFSCHGVRFVIEAAQAVEALAFDEREDRFYGLIADAIHLLELARHYQEISDPGAAKRAARALRQAAYLIANHSVTWG